MRACLYILFLVLFFSANLSATARELTTTIQFRDSIRNRDVQFVVLYYSHNPTDTAKPYLFGDGTHSNLLVFVGDRGYSWKHYNRLLRDVSDDNGVLVLPLSSFDSTANDNDIASDVLSTIEFMIRESKRNASVYYGIDFTRVLCGCHARGANATMLASSLLQNIVGMSLQGLFFVAPTQVSQTSLNLARSMSSPTMIVAGSADCQALTALNAQPLYDSCSSSCKTLVNISGASHCHFAEQNTLCEQRDGSCKSTISASLSQYLCYRRYLLSFRTNINSPSYYTYNEQGDPYDILITIQTTQIRYDNVRVISSKQRACVGDTITFRTNKPLHSYLWLPDSIRTPEYKVIAKNTVGIRLVTLGSCYDVRTDEITITVANAFPVQIEGDLDMCQGDSRVLRVVNDTDFSSIYWSNGEKKSFITVSQAGVYSVRAFDQSTCTFSYDSVIVKYTGPQLHAFTLKATNVPCDTVALFAPNLQERELINKVFKVYVGNGLPQSVVNKTGDYKVWAVLTDTIDYCRRYSDTLRYHYETLSRPKPDVSYSNGVLSTSTKGIYYGWRLNGVYIIGATESTYQPTGNGFYSAVAFYDQKGNCYGVSDSIRILNMSALADEVLHILYSFESTVHLQSTESLQTVRIYNLLGRCCLQQSTDATQLTLDCSALNKGVYVVEYGSSLRRTLLLQ